MSIARDAAELVGKVLPAAIEWAIVELEGGSPPEAVQAELELKFAAADAAIDAAEDAKFGKGAR